MMDCKNCQARHRADHLAETKMEGNADHMSLEQLTAFIAEQGIKCPKCGKKDFTQARQFNLMFETQMAKTGENSTAYLRPETAQAIFLEFKNVIDTTRVKVPFGIGQIGKAFRNEITPGNFIFRVLEFEQMEIEYFVHESEWETHFKLWLEAMYDWCEAIGLEKAKIHELDVEGEALAHYSKKTIDLEYEFPFGVKELYGCAYRTNFDLTNHENASGKKLRWRDPQTNEEYIPHVIEPTFGVDRSILAIISTAYTEETLEGGEVRTVLRLKPVIAPVKVAVLPLTKKDGLPEKATAIKNIVQVFGNCEYDEGGNIGKRYRRQDEIGTPVCVTIDYETLDDQSVTVRDRDTMAQERIKIDELNAYLAKKYFL
jgi:glycyl-tRNA synthetase